MLASRILTVCSLLVPLCTGCVAGGESDTSEDVASSADAMNGHNALSRAAIGSSPLTANHNALAFLRTHSLQEAASGSTIFADYPDMRFQLHDPLAKEAMTYLASCALAKDQTITYVDPFSNDTTTFAGQHGLCTGWAASAPDDACREAVSACMLARVNAVGAHVPLSLRGRVGQLGLAASIPADDTFKDFSTVESFDACPSRTWGASRTCGWVPLSVGTCLPNTVVTVGAGAGATGCDAPLGASTGDTMLRVCQGIYGCDPTTPWSATSYAGLLGQNDDRCGLKPSVTFTCPASGYYSVEIATYDSASAQSDLTDPQKVWAQASAGALPATEAQVFRYLDGAFYGDIFDAQNLAPEVDYSVTSSGQTVGSFNTVVPTIFRRAFACYSPRWNDGMALLTSRLCAGPGANCVMQVAGACTSSPVATTDPTNRCQTSNATGIGDYGGCLDRDGTHRWAFPITTYLNDPCDTVTSAGGTPPASCAKAQGVTMP